MFCGIVSCLWAAPGEARAAVECYALLIGSNRGHADETPLLYAESDVDRVADTLESLGAFPSQNIIRLKGITATEVRETLLDLNLRIQARQRARNDASDAMLFVYYSGHGSAGTLHLRGSDLKTEELSKWVRLSPARLKLLLLDACRTGTLTRVKGGKAIEPFEIGFTQALSNDGYAIITSSAAGEDAQENDALRSSVFTHHFLGALRGLGDSNGDQLVTLGEAYGYAYTQALRTSMTTTAGLQHATFDYDLRGRADPVLTDLRRQQDQARLVLREAGDYLIVPESGRGALLEAHVTGDMARAGGPTVNLPAVRYQVRLRTPQKVWQSEITLKTGQKMELRNRDMRALPLAQVVRKGQMAGQIATGPSAYGSVHGPLGSGFSPAVGVQLGWAVEWPMITLMPRLNLARSTPTTLPDNVVSHQLDEITAEITALYVFDIGPVSVAPSLSAGATFLRQHLQFADNPACRAQGCQDTRRPVGLLTSVGVWAGVPIAWGVAVEGWAELGNFLVGRSGDDGLGGAATYRASLGIGYRY